MNLQMLNAVGPGFQQGQQNAVQLADMQMAQQARMKAVADAAAQQRASAWMGGGGLATALGGLASPVPGGASPAAMPGPLPSPVAAPQGGGIGGPGALPPPPPAPPATRPGVSGTAYSEPTVDKLARLLIGEAGGEDDNGQLAVAAVVRNRAKQSGLSLDDVIAAPNQFEPYSNRKRWGELQSIDPSNPAYIRARSNAMRILQDEVDDPTGGADHFYSPSGQRAFGRAAPSWDNGKGTDLGRHRFFKLGWRGEGVPRSDNADAAGGVDAGAEQPLEAQAAAMGHPDEPDYGQPYSPMDSLRMTMQLADFIGARYKEVTGEELAPHLLMDQVDRVAKLSNQFTGAQRLAVQQGVAGLRAQVAVENNVRTTETSRANTGDRVAVSERNNVRTTETSRANTGDRVAQSDTNSARAAATSRANTGDRVAQSDTNNRRTTETSRANTTDRNRTSERNTDERNRTSTTNAQIGGQSRVDSSRVNMGKEPSSRWEGEGPKPEKQKNAPKWDAAPRVDPLKPPPANKPTIDKGAAGPKSGTVAAPVRPAAKPTGGTGPKLPDPKGVAEGTVLRAKGKTPGQLGKPEYILKNGQWKKL